MTARVIPFRRCSEPCTCDARVIASDLRIALKVANFYFKRGAK